MRSILALAAAAAFTISAPAFAQSVGAPGAVGVTGGLIGSNTPGGGVNLQRWYSDNGAGYAYGYDNAPRFDGAPPPDYYQGPTYPYQPGFMMGSVAANAYAAPPLRDYADDTPRTVRGDQNGQDQNY